MHTEQNVIHTIPTTKKYASTYYYVITGIHVLTGKIITRSDSILVVSKEAKVVQRSSNFI
jgi:hypothetical protein